MARKVEEAVQARVAALSEAVAALADGVTVQSGGVTAPAETASRIVASRLWARSFVTESGALRSWDAMETMSSRA